MSEDVTERTLGRRWYHRRDARFLIFVALVLGAYYAWGVIAGPNRMSPELRVALKRDAERLIIVVHSKFPPEQFHIGIYQDLGSIRGTQGNAATLHRVRPSDVHRLSRYYWIERIDLEQSN